MHRRTFSKFVGAFIVAPVVQLEPSRDPHKYLQMFCDDDISRYDLGSPYEFKGNVYGTDARVMARVHSAGAILTDATRRIPKETATVWDGHFASAESKWRPLDPVDLVPDPGGRGCPLCLDRPSCSRCEGDGFVYDFLYDCQDICPQCFGVGVTPNARCPLCSGRTHGDDIPSVQMVGDKRVDGKYYLQLAKIPGLEINYASRDLESPILFRSDIGIAGIQMPLTKL